MLLAQDIRPLVRSSQQRFAIIAAVAGIHIAVIAAFLSGLAPKVFAPESGPIIVTVVPDRTHLPPPAPPPVVDTLVRPTVPNPDVPIIRESDASTIHEPPATPTPNTHSVDLPVRIAAAQPIMGTHTTPDYPLLDTRQGHEGNVLLRLSINEWGAVTDAQVERSSGYESLDRAAASWVKSHWLYHPATRAGDPIPTTTEAIVTFRLNTH
jgi:protein TonB